MKESLYDQSRFRAVMERLGKPGSRGLLSTPALVCDLDLLVENIALLAERTAQAHVALRPHVKSHKTAYVARLQLKAGASGLSFAKLSEAEAVVARLLAEGYEGRVSALLTSPLVGTELAQRALAFAKHCDVIVVADHLDGVREMASAAEQANVELSVLCDVDVGVGRTGVANPDAALRVVERIEASPFLHFAGVQGYGGHLQHIHGHEERTAATIESTRKLQLVIETLESNGYSVALRTGGGTGTSEIDLELGVLNELQCGSYVFMDRQYRDALGDDAEGSYFQSLTIDTTVISDNQERVVTVDAGLKAIATDADAPLVVGHEGSVDFQFFGDEHGLITRGVNDPFRRGDRLQLVPPHCDPTVDRYDVIWIARGDVVLEAVDVVARGCSQ
jgi:D-serine deaminase-like pyridoxal phosphate-dependent protein